MRIFYVNPRFPKDHWDGARVHVTQVIKHLVAQGHQVWTLPLYPLEQAHVIPHEAIAKVRQLLRMDACYIRIEGSAPRFPALFRPPLRLLARGVPIVWELNSTPELRFYGREAKDVSKQESALRQLAAVTALAICNTDGLARFAADMGVSATVTVPLGSDPESFRPDVPPDRGIPRNDGVLNVLWCGNASVGWHDMGTMVKAARILDGKSPIKFFIVSKIRPVEGVLPSNMIHLAPRPYVNMPPLLSAMDVGLAIYRKESWSRYGTFSSPLKVFDYLSSGLIAVCSPIEQAAKLHARSPKAVKLVPFEEPGLLADALLHIAATARESSDRATAARALVIEYYNWSRVACETATAIARIGTKRE